jgi:hypothetical protein
MRHWTLSAAIGVAILNSTSGSASPVQGVVSGQFVLDEVRNDNAFQAIERAIADLSDAKRPLARTRLRKSIAVCRIRISIAGDRVGIAYDAKTPIVVWTGEEPVKWKLIEELVFDVSAKADGEAIALTFRGDDSERTTTYRSVGQNLMEDTIITSPMLATPIVYKQVYNRTDSQNLQDNPLVKSC